jgi:hypothetical protein
MLIIKETKYTIHTVSVRTFDEAFNYGPGPGFGTVINYGSSSARSVLNYGSSSVTAKCYGSYNSGSATLEILPDDLS